MSASPKGRPRKRQPKPGERVPLGLRVTPEVKRLLDATALRSGRSQSQEAELRIEYSLRDDRSLFDLLDHIYGAETAALLTSFGEVIKAIGLPAPQLALARSKEEQPNATWLNDPFLFDEIVKALNIFLEALRPAGDRSPPKRYEIQLEDCGKKHAHKMLELLAGREPPNAELQRWAPRWRSKLKIAGAADNKGGG